jgi:hypothetical protein
MQVISIVGFSLSSNNYSNLLTVMFILLPMQDIFEEVICIQIYVQLLTIKSAVVPVVVKNLLVGYLYSTNYLFSAASEKICAVDHTVVKCYV